MEAISHAGTVLGVLAADGVVLAAEKKVTGKLLDLSVTKEGGYGGSGEKIYLLTKSVVHIVHLIYNSFYIKQCCRRGCRSHGRRKLARQLRQDGRSAPSIHIQ